MLCDGRTARVICRCSGDEDDRPLTLRPLPSGNYQICCDECGNPVIDDDPKDWRELAEAAIMNMRRYAADELPHRRMVSVRACEERFALIDRTTGHGWFRPKAGEEMMGDLIELAEQCEKATGPDRVIDGEIFKTLFDGPQFAWKDDWDDCPGVWWREDDADPCAWEGPQQFTASIDAAMQLVPEDLAVIQRSRRRWPVSALDQATLYDGMSAVGEGNARTPALALCAAALRARASQEGGSVEGEG